MNNRRVLIVDDEINLLRSLQRNLRNTYDLTLAEGGIAGFEQILHGGPFAVIVSDLQMPDVDGFQVLELARILSSESYRIMLTGTVKGNTALYGNGPPWFHCVNKPCNSERLCAVFNEGVDRYEIAISKNSERAGLNAAGCSSDDPSDKYRRDALDRCRNLRLQSRCVGTALKLHETYPYELAGMLSQISRLVVDPFRDSPQAGDCDDDVLKEQARRSGDIIRQIPRLANVADMVALQYEADFPTDTSVSVQRGAKILRMLTDFDVLKGAMPESQALRKMKDRATLYGDELFQRFSDLVLRSVSCERVNMAAAEPSDGSPARDLRSGTRESGDS